MTVSTWKSSTLRLPERARTPHRVRVYTALETTAAKRSLDGRNKSVLGRRTVVVHQRTDGARMATTTVTMLSSPSSSNEASQTWRMRTKSSSRDRFRDQNRAIPPRW
jgi:hypothetical protein